MVYALTTMTQENDWPELMTPSEAARILRRSPGAVRYMLRHKQLAGVVIGGRWLIRKDEVKRVVEEGTAPVVLAGGRKHSGHVVEAEDEDQDQDRPAVSPDQLPLDMSQRRPAGQSENVRRFPAARVVGEKGWK